MKKVTLALGLCLALLFVFTACTKQETPPESSEGGSPLLYVYRGKVDEVMENGSLLVSQLEGHNYGQESIVFHMDENAVKKDVPEDGIQPDAYVELYYSGVLTRSMPPQGIAESLRYIAPHSDGIVVNGTIQEVSEDDDSYTINLLPLNAKNASFENQIVLQVPKYAVEGFDENAPVPGTKVSAVTKGIATMSLPPQMPVDTLLPYST